MEEKKKIETTAKKSYKPSYDNKSKGNFRNKKKFTRKKFVYRKKVCFFCKNPDIKIDYKDSGLMKRFIIDSGKISPRRFTGTCAKHQRKLSNEIKKSRQMALIKYTDKH